MTPDQIDRAIAESLGWTRVRVIPPHPNRTYEGAMVVGRPPEKSTDRSPIVPNYYNSLDACAQFEKTLPGDAVEYCEKLCEVTGAEPNDRVFLCREVITATAPQRCEAYLKFVNLWRDA